jgi:carbon starvation protein CstA
MAVLWDGLKEILSGIVVITVLATVAGLQPIVGPIVAAGAGVVMLVRWAVRKR